MYHSVKVYSGLLNSEHQEEKQREVTRMIWRTGNRDPRECGFSFIGGTGGMG